MYIHSWKVLPSQMLFCCFNQFPWNGHLETHKFIKWNRNWYNTFSVSFSFPLRCNFERSLCRWTQLPDDDFDWTRNQGSTASYGTGPMFDHTVGTSAGNVLLSSSLGVYFC